MALVEEEAVSLEETVRVLEQGRVTAGEDNQRVFSVNDRTFTEIAVLGKSKNNKTYLVQGASGKAVVKALNDRLTVTEDAQERSKAIELFEREAAVLARLNHPQIPKLYHVFQAEVLGEVGFYLMQEYFAGRNLEEVIKQRGKLSAQEAVSILLSLLNPVEYLHSQEPGPVVHRDIKPANILWDGVEAKLVDLGSVLDKKNDPMSGSTIAGTRGHMAPEHWLGKASPQSDIYSLGAALLQMITGVEPETLRETEATSFEQKFTLGYKKQLGANIDHKLQGILDKCLDFDVQKRYSSVAELRQDLQQYLETPAIVKVENITPSTTSFEGFAGVVAPIVLPLTGLAIVAGLLYGTCSFISSQEEERYRREHVHVLDTEEVAVLVDQNGYVKADEHQKGVETDHKAETVYEYPTPGMVVLSREIILPEQNGEVKYPVQGVLRYTIIDPVATHLSSEAWRESNKRLDSFNGTIVDSCTKGNECLKNSLDHFLQETVPKAFTSPEQLRTKYATIDNGGTKEGTPAYFVKTEFERYFPNGLQFQSFEYSVGMPIKQKK